MLNLMESKFGRNKCFTTTFTSNLFVVVQVGMKPLLPLMLMVLTQHKMFLLKLVLLLMKPPLMNLGESEISSFILLDALKLVSNVMDQLKMIAQDVKITGLLKMVNVYHWLTSLSWNKLSKPKSLPESTTGTLIKIKEKELIVNVENIH